MTDSTPTPDLFRDVMYLNDDARESAYKLREKYPQFDEIAVGLSVFDATVHALGLDREGIVKLLTNLNASYRIGLPTLFLTDDDD